ncbi:MAG: chemotaxis protein CheW [Acidobacteria bacterium]|nr:chemotaxis protein CheW [Acidobacteriota bacterium]
MKYALLFRVGKTLMALDVRFVSHVLKEREITPVPDAPDYVEGVFAYREHIVSVVKIDAKYELDAVSEGRLFLVAVEDILVAFRVSEILDVIEVNEDEIKTGDAGNMPVSGVLARNGKPVMVLDLDLVLSEQERKLLRALY